MADILEATRSSMRAFCVVAHPDDCAIYGYQFIMDHRDWDWEICYLTYHPQHARVVEMQEFWAKRGIPIKASGFPDIDNIATDEVERYLQAICRNKDIILTHNSVGEYGHPHHKLIHDIMLSVNVPKVYFGTWPDHANHLIELGQAPFDLDEIPIHKKALDGCDLTSWKYLITPEAQNLVNYTHE